MNGLKFATILVSALSVTFSCSKDLFMEENEPSDALDATISVEKALDCLNDFLVESNVTKSNFHQPKEILTIRRILNGTKSIQGDTLPLLYVVNFDEGYAVLAADSRINDNIIAVAENGNLAESDFFPDDTTLGENDDLSLEQYHLMDSAGYVGSLSETRLTATLCRKYADCQLSVISEEGYPYGSGETNSSSGESFEWIATKSVKYKLGTLWNQREPFNNLCPLVGIDKCERAPVGCVPLAVGQIIAYHEYPNLTCNGVAIDFDLIKEIKDTIRPSYTGTTDGQNMAQHFMHILSGLGYCEVLYGKIFNMAFGFALPSNAKQSFVNFGYKNVELNWNYDESRIIRSLDNDCPVFISAVAGLVSGHAWVIDGYIKRDYVSNSGVVAKSQCLVHCNWGWNGHNNGYFTSGIFETKNPIMSDGWRADTMDESYWYAFNTITYDKPE